MPPAHVIVLAVDGLRASPIGAYGGPAATPEIDRFASRATLYDWHFAEAPEIDRAYAAIGGGLASLTGPRHATLLIDGEPPFNPDPVGFDAVEVYPEAVADAPAETIADTWLAARMGQFAEALDAAMRQPGPQLVWMHTGGFFAPWDVPAGIAQAMLDEEDAPIAPATTPAAGPVADDDPDASFVASCRYAAQLQAFDSCFGSLIDLIDARFAEDSYQFVLLGVRGYALGEHGVIGSDDRLYAESLHTPLIVYSSDASGAMARVGSLVGSSSLPAVLAGEGELPNTIQQTARSGARAAQQGEWRLIEPPGADKDTPVSKLYLKPDDRWEANDVASLLPDVVERMQSLLPPPVAMAASDDSK